MARRPIGPSRARAARLPAGAVALLRREIEEDRAAHDRTTRALARGPRPGSALLESQGVGVLSGLAASVRLARSFGLRATPMARDGDRLRSGRAVLRLDGDLRWILGAERTILNALMHLSGVATLTARAVRAVRAAGGEVAVYGTRKTLPGLRDLEKAAVVHGGGHAHRRDLSDGFLWKRGHGALAGFDEGIGSLRRAAGPRGTVEAEVRTLAEARRALDAGADALLLDNLTPSAARRIIRDLSSDGRRESVWIELSGGITVRTIGRYARTGADAVSLGSLTHSAPALPFHVRWVRSTPRRGRRAGGRS